MRFILGLVAASAPNSLVAWRECPRIDTVYGYVEKPVVDYFIRPWISGIVNCVSNRTKSTAPLNIHPKKAECPEPETEDYYRVQASINTACVNQHQVQHWVNQYLESDFFGSAHVIDIDANFSVKCSKSDVEIGIDNRLVNDLRHVYYDTRSFVQWRRNDTIDGIVLEPVWSFIHRAVNNDTYVSVEIGNQVRSSIVSSERNTNITVSVHEAGDSKLLVKREPIGERIIEQSEECHSCVEKYMADKIICLNGKPITNECGMIVGECAHLWWMIKRECDECLIPV